MCVCVLTLTLSNKIKKLISIIDHKLILFRKPCFVCDRIHKKKKNTTSLIQQLNKINLNISSLVSYVLDKWVITAHRKIIKIGFKS